jgi:hypothetical protein
MDIIVEVNKLEQYDYDKIRSIILEKGKPANDILFENKLKGDLYEENVGATRYILSSIELTESQTKERYTNFYARNKNIFVWTVEHILPQGENIPSEWVEMIANGDKDLANQIRKEYVHKLGNLTLTGYNSNLGNLSLSKKQDRKNNEGKYIGYKNGLILNDSIMDTTNWSKEKIEDRTNYLVEKSINIFKL